jgi:hypothetical protein
MSDRDWLVPSTLLTCLSGAVALALIPSYRGIMPAVGVLPYWMLAAAMIGAIYGFFVMVAAGVDSPFQRIREAVIDDRRRFLVIAFALCIAGLNLTTFMWTKPLLNYLVPFWADPLLADMDYWLFLGNDPWTFLTWLNSSAFALFYHRGWFVMMILTLIIVLAKPASPQKSALLVTYFLLWSVAGPVIHTLLPAAGPIFYAEMGYGERFAALQNVSETSNVAEYLWNVYSGQGFAPGAGISAMPSLHIATTAWMLMALHIFRHRMMVPMALAGFLIFLLSIALGWHYAVDGIVGGAVALLFYRGLLFYYEARPRWGRKPAVALGQG